MNTDTPPAKPQHNKLALPEQIKVLDWCRQNEEKVKTLPDTALAQIAEAELGFKITVPNLTSVRQAASIEKLKPTAPPTLEERVTQLENLFAAHFPLCKPPALPSPPLPAPDSPETLPGLENAN